MGKKYKAEVTVSFDVEFEDDSDLCIEDQAFEAATDFLPMGCYWDVEVKKVYEKADDEAA